MRLAALFICAAAGLSGEERQGWADFSRNGLELGSEQSDFSAEVHFRGQFRSTSGFEEARRLQMDFVPRDSNLEVRRGRVKGGGRFLGAWMRFKFEHSLLQNRSLDAKLTLAKLPWLQLSAGQWKVDYQREQIGSSGDQQYAERSIVNRAFTFNRQKGVAVHGQIGEGRPWDVQYWSGLFLGNGRGFRQDELTEKEHGDSSPLWASRLQWNALNGGVDFSQSDIERSPKPLLSLAVGAARNRSRYTRFSGSGGGQLEGFAPGELGQYSNRQLLFDAGFKHRGLSIQHELHSKRIRDRLAGRTTLIRGGYLQAGYFFHEIWKRVPKPLELAARGAFVDRDSDLPGDRYNQLGFAINWFFEGHDNKLTLDVFRYNISRPGSDPAGTQVRLQWDLTI